jgi:hypothetical protein
MRLVKYCRLPWHRKQRPIFGGTCLVAVKVSAAVTIQSVKEKWLR